MLNFLKLDVNVLRYSDVLIKISEVFGSHPYKYTKRYRVLREENSIKFMKEKTKKYHKISIQIPYSFNNQLNQL